MVNFLVLRVVLRSCKFVVVLKFEFIVWMFGVVVVCINCGVVVGRGVWCVVLRVFGMMFIRRCC